MTSKQQALHTEQLLAAARHATGIQLDDKVAHERLKPLLVSLNGESVLHKAGSVAMEGKLIRLLSNRLRMQRDLHRHPEILNQQITAPVIICGAARTGTTFLQQQLAATGTFNTLPFWQCFHPALISGDLNESPAQRIAEADSFIAAFVTASPLTRHVHRFAVHAVEEETLMLEQSLLSSSFACWSDVSTYEKTLSDATFRTMLDYFKTQLQYLQWQGLADKNKRWLLKCPWYYGMAGEVLGVFPDAKLIVSQRDPVDTVPSTLYLLEQFYQPYTTQKPNITQWVMRMALASQQHLEGRQAIAAQLLEFPYATLVNDFDSVFQQLCAFIGMTVSSDAKNVIQQQVANNAEAIAAPHYALGDYGLTPALIGRLFESYATITRSQSTNYSLA